jgi:hypothetical protein
MYRTALVLITCCWATATNAADLTNEQRAFFERCEAAAKAFIPRAEQDTRFQRQYIARTKAARIGRGGYPTKEAKQEAIKRAEAVLAAMETALREVKEGDRLVAPPFRGCPGKGDIGRPGPGNNIARVIQVVSKDSVLADVTFGSKSETVFVDKIDTSDAVDDERVRLNSNFKVMGPRTYEAALGTANTVLWLRAVDINDELLTAWKAYQEEKRGQ